MNVNAWLVVLLMGLVTFAIRLSFFHALDKVTMPDWLNRSLHYVPPAVLSAIIFPEMLRPQNSLDLSLSNERLIAGLVAGLVAWRTRNVLLTIVIGMVVLWLFKSIVG